MYEHKNGLTTGFASKYNLQKLVHFEHYNDISKAIEREKQLKGGSRAKKVKLILDKNPGWLELVI